MLVLVEGASLLPPIDSPLSDEDLLEYVQT